MTTISKHRWVAIAIALLSVNAAAQSARPIDADKARKADYWTGERRANAIPRDLVIDPRGLGYLRHRDGYLQPYGHNRDARESQGSPTPSPFARPGGDATLPSISGLDPSGGTIGGSYLFKALVTDDVGVRSVTFKLQKGTSTVQSFNATNTVGTTWSVSLQGFTNGSWKWWVVAKDKAGNTQTSNPITFAVDTGGSGGGGSGTNGAWTSGEAVKKAAGRIYFEMPSNAKHTRWAGYVCSGTVATDDVSGRSLIITAAHCVYDDVNKAFARNVLFIPDQAGTSGTGTDLNCNNDPMGCWVPSFGVVDLNWTTRTFPDNIPWDYAFYVVSDSAHSGASAPSPILDVATGSLQPVFTEPKFSVDNSSVDFTHALGYSYSEDPQFMYCAEDMITEGAANWWLPSCGLSGGSSGGPWVQPMDLTNGSGPIISVNSWGYTSSPGMAGPKLSGTSASCVYTNAKSIAFAGVSTFDGQEGKAVTCP